MPDIFSLSLPNGQHYPYRVVPSKRAKYIRIKLSRQGDLSVTLPSRTRFERAHEFVRKKRAWIEKNLDKISHHSQNILPEELNLRLLDEIWKVRYLEVTNENISVSEDENLNVLIEGPKKILSDYTIVAKILNHWCKQKAIGTFTPMLENLAEVHGFHYRRLSIRAQKTRWGSCSQDKNISLNCKLLFMPESVVNYVMIHELCHTVEMNHSTRFWTLVEECDSNYKIHRSELKQLGKTMLI